MDPENRYEPPSLFRRVHFLEKNRAASTEIILTFRTSVVWIRRAAFRAHVLANSIPRKLISGLLSASELINRPVPEPTSTSTGLSFSKSVNKSRGSEEFPISMKISFTFIGFQSVTVPARISQQLSQPNPVRNAGYSILHADPCGPSSRTIPAFDNRDRIVSANS